MDIETFYEAIQGDIRSRCEKHLVKVGKETGERWCSDDVDRMESECFYALVDHLVDAATRGVNQATGIRFATAPTELSPLETYSTNSSPSSLYTVGTSLFRLTLK